MNGYIERINNVAHLLPIEVLTDINTRITDYLSVGGNIDDEYIGQQLRFVNNFIQYMKMEVNDNV